MLTPKEIEAFNAKASEHNAAVKSQLRSACVTLVENIKAMEELAGQLVVTGVDQNLRLKEILMGVASHCRIQVEQQAIPMLQPTPSTVGPVP